MENKEFKVGEVFQYGTINLKCIKCDSDIHFRCNECLFKGYECGIVQMYLGECRADKRSDKTNVIFVEEE